jgi:hypothetical protein
MGETGPVRTPARNMWHDGAAPHHMLRSHMDIISKHQEIVNGKPG